jgi:hypothetical protein
MQRQENLAKTAGPEASVFFYGLFTAIPSLSDFFQ